MELNLKKPLVFFDLETTGVDILRDRIVEISIIKVMPGGKEVEKTRRVNPEMHIPEEATAVHGIKDEDVAGEPTFRQIAKSLANEMTGCDIAGFNSNRFDVPMLDQEFQRAGVKFDFSKVRFIDVQTIYHKKEPRTLVAAHRFYCGGDFPNAHNASADTRATYEVLKAQLDHYDDLPNDVEELSKFSSANRNMDFMGRIILDENDRPVVNFGKYKGKRVEDVFRQDPSYYDWILKGDFAQNTKDCFTRIKLSMK